MMRTTTAAKPSAKAAALLTFLWHHPDASEAEVRAAGFTARMLTRLAGGRDGSLPRWLTWDHRTGGYRLTRSGKSVARRQIYTLAA